MRDQDVIRRILIIVIMVLIVAVIVLIASLITRGTCSSVVNNGITPTNVPEPSSLIIDVNSSELPVPETAHFNTEPPVTEPIVPEPTAFVTQNPLQPMHPSIPQSPYPAIPYCVTEGTFQDVKDRLELLKQLPRSETVILLDVGHGGFDGGTVGIDTNVTEAALNLQIGRMLAEQLAAKGYFVFMTRMGVYAVGSDKNSDMKWRKQVMKLEMFDASISVHQNALATDRSVRGARIYHYKTGTEGENLAKTIIAECLKISEYARPNAYTGNLMVVREPICPSALIECGFLSNHDEELLLQDPNYQMQIAKAVADGIENYLNSK